jgi:protein-tyrosine phosphatase
MSKHMSSNEGQVRHIPLQGQVNFRDLGGYRTSDGRTVKWGEVYRSGRLPKLSDQDVLRLESLSIRTVVNLLTEDDMEVYGRDRLPVGVRELPLPIDSETATEMANMLNTALKTGDFSMMSVEMNPEIHRLLIHDGVQEYAALLREIANPDNRPLVFHCSHGVHRTGTGAAILLSALGVPWETIREDYLLSNKYRHDEVQVRLVQLRQMAAEKRGITPEQVDMTNMEAFLIQAGSYIDASKEEMIDEFGSVDGFITEGLKLGDHEIKQLRAELLE